MNTKRLICSGMFWAGVGGIQQPKYFVFGSQKQQIGMDQMSVEFSRYFTSIYYNMFLKLTWTDHFHFLRVWFCALYRWFQWPRAASSWVRVIGIPQASLVLTPVGVLCLRWLRSFLALVSQECLGDFWICRGYFQGCPMISLFMITRVSNYILYIPCGHEPNWKEREDMWNIT